MGALSYAGKARSLALAWGTGRATAPSVDARAAANAAESAVRATLPHVPMDTTERASVAGKASAAAKTPTERSEAAAAAARSSHTPLARFRRAIKAWEAATDDERRQIRRELRAAGIIA